MKQGAFNVCETCGYKVISKTHFDNHVKTHVVDYAPQVEVKPEEVVEVAPVEVLPVVETPTDEIVIKFTKPVEVTINGIHFDGTEIKVKNMSVASEIVRLAREAYGPTILA